MTNSFEYLLDRGRAWRRWKSALSPDAV